MPRNVIPIELQRLRGNPSKRKLHAGPQPPQTEEPPEPLAFLNEGAQAEWRRVGKRQAAAVRRGLAPFPGSQWPQ
jgi:hypothetical protein